MHLEVICLITSIILLFKFLSKNNSMSKSELLKNSFSFLYCLMFRQFEESLYTFETFTQIQEALYKYTLDRLYK